MDVESMYRAVAPTPGPYQRPSQPAAAPVTRPLEPTAEALPAPAAAKAPPGALRLRVPKLYVVQDVRLPIVYH